MCYLSASTERDLFIQIGALLQFEFVVFTTLRLRSKPTTEWILHKSSWSTKRSLSLNPACPVYCLPLVCRCALKDTPTTWRETPGTRPCLSRNWNWVATMAPNDLRLSRNTAWIFFVLGDGKCEKPRWRTLKYNNNRPEPPSSESVLNLHNKAKIQSFHDWRNVLPRHFGGLTTFCV